MDAEAKQDSAVGVLTSEQAGRLLMISSERVRQLTKEGWITKLGKDRYRLVDVVQGYIRFRNDADRRSQKNTGDSRVRDARAYEIELRVAQKQRLLIEKAEAIEFLDRVVGVTRAELAGLPARVTRDLQLRRVIEQAINELLNRIADIIAELERTPSAGGASVPTVEGENA